jgi:hypothetical protein
MYPHWLLLHHFLFCFGRNPHKIYSRGRGRQQKRYRVIAIMLRYVLELSHNASTLWRKVIASFSYHSGFIEIVVPSYSYRPSLIGIVIASSTYRSNVTKSLLLLTNTARFLSSGVDLIWEKWYWRNIE